MSFWTYVNAVVYVKKDENLDEIKSVFGKEYDPYSEHINVLKMTDEEYDEYRKKQDELYEHYKAHKDEYLPCGSEGSLHIQVKNNPKCRDYNRIKIWGGLRDFTDSEGLVEWFKECVEKIGNPIVKAYIEANCSWGDDYIWSKNTYKWYVRD